MIKTKLAIVLNATHYNTYSYTGLSRLQTVGFNRFVLARFAGTKVAINLHSRLLKHKAQDKRPL